nr:MAG TPA: hypothetical protein [Caudoviricetes sp.]DAI06785.1 MAG TPA: hypothetical protein [Bacteriophage sp.]DAJ79241.1 MAG TPA: hypothetical protein [Caudoviricetes sp.]
MLLRSRLLLPFPLNEVQAAAFSAFSLASADEPVKKRRKRKNV